MNINAEVEIQHGKNITRGNNLIMDRGRISLLSALFMMQYRTNLRYTSRLDIRLMGNTPTITIGSSAEYKSTPTQTGLISPYTGTYNQSLIRTSINTDTTRGCRFTFTIPNNTFPSGSIFGEYGLYLHMNTNTTFQHELYYTSTIGDNVTPLNNQLFSRIAVADGEIQEIIYNPAHSLIVTWDVYLSF